MRMRRWMAALLALCLMAGLLPASLAEGIAPEGDVVFSEAVDPEVAESEIVLGEGDAESDGYADFLLEDAPAVEPSGTVAVDAAHFPDPSFRLYVTNRFDKDGSGTLSDAERAAVTEMDDLYDLGIVTLRGVELFTALKKLTCWGNPIAALDVGKNAKLEELSCYDCRLEALDLSKNAALDSLDCSGNQLAALDLSANPALDDLNCSGNQLAELDLRANALLEELDCSDNALTKLEIAGCAALESFDCSGNRLASVDLTGCAVLLDHLRRGEVDDIAYDESTDLLDGGVSLKVPASVALDKEGTVSLKKGKTLRLKASVTPAIARTGLAWSTSDAAVATVDQTGLVTGVKAGRAEITVATDNGKTASVAVSVFDPKDPSSVKIDQGKTATMFIGKSLKLTATQKPKGCTAAITWKSSDKTIAKVGKTTGKVKALKAGTVKITATAENGRKAKITITVRDPKKPDKVKIKQGKEASVYVCRTLQLTAQQVPAGSTAKVTWKSSNTSVATVDKNGKVTGVRAGKAVITAKTANKKKAKITVTVKRNRVTGVNPKPSVSDVTYGRYMLYLKSVEIVDAGRVECEYYLANNLESGKTGVGFPTFSAKLKLGSKVIVDGKPEKITLNAPSQAVTVFRVVFTGDAVKNTAVKLNGKKSSVTCKTTAVMRYKRS